LSRAGEISGVILLAKNKKPLSSRWQICLARKSRRKISALVRGEISENQYVMSNCADR